MDPEDPPAMNDPHERLSVLLIEDNKVDARAVHRILEGETPVGFDVTTVSSLDAGTDRADRANVVILDLGLPDSHGLETLERFREHAPEIPVVILTGLEDQSVALEALRGGADDYLVKDQLSPFPLIHSLLSSVDAAKARKDRPSVEPDTREGSAARDAIVSGAGEEIKARSTYIMNNLAQIQELAARLEEGPASPDVADQLAKASQEAMEGLARIDALGRDLVQMGPGRRPVRSTLRAPAVSAVNLFQSMRPRDVGLDAKLQPTPKLEIDFLEIQQAVLGLLKIAAEQTPAGGRVVVLTRDRDSQPEILVQAEPRQGDRVATRRGSDQLADSLESVQETVKGHGGTLEFLEDDDGGLTFRARFPAE